MKNYYQKTAQEVLKELKVSLKNGLSKEEAQKRIEKFGKNEIKEEKESALKRFFKRFWGPIPWMIEIAAVLAISVRHWEEFYIIITMLIVNGFLDFYQESKALDAIKALKEKIAKKALVLREGKWLEIEAKELTLGDIVKVKIGEIVPADIKIAQLSDYALVDQSSLTGESLPVEKKENEVVYSNTILKQGEIVGIVIGVGLNTYFGKSVALIEKAKKEHKSHFQQMVIKVGDFLIALSVIMIAIIFFYGIRNGENISELLVFSLVLTVAAIPVALPTVLTVTMAIGALNLAKKKTVVTKLSAIEELAGVDVLCSDKTGTLTQNKMSIADAFVLPKYSQKQLFLYAILASREENNDPLEKPIFEYAKKVSAYSLTKMFELKKFIPFNPLTKRSEGIYAQKGEEKNINFIKGAPQVVVALSNHKEFDETLINKKVEEFAQNGFRTIAVAYRKPTEEKYHFVGLIPLYDPPREDSKEAIKEANRFGVEVKMLTGDNIAVAKYIAKILGIGENILDVRELKGENTREYEILSAILSKAFFKTLYPNYSKEEIDRFAKEVVREVRKELHNIPLPKGHIKKHESEIIDLIEEADGFAQVFPQDKYFIVEKLQESDHIVGMTGDGVNDAAALKKADIGIAVKDACDAAKASADIVLLSSGLKVIIEGIKEARVIFERMKSYTIFRIAETIRIVIFMTLAIVVFDFYPLTSVMIIVLALLNDIPILAIAYDNTKLKLKPLRWDMRHLLVASSWLGIAGVISSFVIFYLAMIYLRQNPNLSFLPSIPQGVDASLLDSWEGFVQSLFFAKMVIAGHGTIYNTRTSEWFFKKPYPSLILFLATFSTRILGTIIAVYGFGIMTPIGWEWGIFMWIYALVWFVLNDFIKVLVISYYKKRKIVVF